MGNNIPQDRFTFHCMKLYSYYCIYNQKDTNYKLTLLNLDNINHLSIQCNYLAVLNFNNCQLGIKSVHKIKIMGNSNQVSMDYYNFMCKNNQKDTI